MNKLIDEVSDTQIQCPHCNMMNCYETTYTDLKVYLCFSCGFVTNSNMIIGSEYVKEHFILNKNVAQFIKDIHYVDIQRNLIWYPTVLQFPELGVIFPEPDGDDWGWTYVQEVPILETEKEKFKIEGTDEYYKTKLDMENSKRYNKYNFYNACIDMGIIKSPIQDIN